MLTYPIPASARRLRAAQMAFFIALFAALGLLLHCPQAAADENAPAPPTITSFSPASGKFPDFVTITGTGFTQASQVAIGGVPSAKVIVDSPTQIRAVVRSLAKTGTITVTTPSGTGTSASVFVVTWTADEGPGAPPVITSFDPTSGKFPDFVTITGTGFTHASQVTIGGVPSAKIFVDSDTQIRALVRSIAYTGPITVTTPRGTATSTAIFTVTKHY